VTPASLLAQVWLRPLGRSLRTSSWGERARALAMAAGFAGFLALLAGLFSPILRAFWSQEAFGAALTRGVIYFLFLALAVLTVFSAVISMSSRFFTAPDAELFLARPVAEETYFRFRYWQGALATSWMFLPFWLPLLVALRRAAGAGWGFLAWGLIAPLPLGWIACSLAAGLVMLAARRFSAHKLKNAFVSSTALLAVGLLLLLRLIRPETLTRPGGAVTLDQFIKAWSPAPRLWDPLALAADSVMLALSDPWAALGRSALLWALAAALYFILARRAGRGFLKAWLASRELMSGSSGTGQRESRLWRGEPGPFRLLWLKEVSAAARNPVLRLQMLLTGALSGIFLYSLYRLPFDENPGLRQLLFLPVCGFSQLIVISVATRFIFPIESVEAPGSWLLRVAPLSPRAWLLSRVAIYAPPLLFLDALLVLSCLRAFKPEPAEALAAILLMFFSPLGIAALTGYLGLAWKQRDASQPEEVTTSPAGMLVMALGMLYVAAQVALFYPPLLELRRHSLQLMVPVNGLVFVVCGILWAALQAAVTLIPMGMAARRMQQAG
jgi:hypothetical protein